MKEYTVILLYPDYIAENHGEETYITYASVKSKASAIKKARKEAARANSDRAFPSDFFVIGVIEGRHKVYGE